MDTLKKVQILVIPVILWGCLCGLGCQKKDDTETLQKEQVTPIRPSMEESGSLGKMQMPSDMSGKFPKAMLEALQKSGHKRADSPGVEKGHVPVSVPPDVQSKWKSVVIEVSNKLTDDKKDYVVDIKQSFIIPDTKIRMDVLTFLPDFSMSPKRIISLSNELRNPAAEVVIYEDGNKIFEGWLFQKLPTVHPFEHKVYAIKLKGQESA